MGQPKHLLRFGQELLLERLVRILGKRCNPVCVVRGADNDLPLLPDAIRIVEDEYPGRGPLAGIHVGLKTLNRAGIESAFVTACDCPLLKIGFVEYLLDQLGPGHDIVLVTDGKHLNVLGAIYRTAVYRSAARLLSQGKARPVELTSLHPTRIIDAERLKEIDPNLDSLVNMNCPDDYNRALEQFQKS